MMFHLKLSRQCVHTLHITRQYKDPSKEIDDFDVLFHIY